MTEQESPASETQEAAKPEASQVAVPAAATEPPESPAEAVDSEPADPLLAHPHLNALADFVREAALGAVAARRADFASRFHAGGPVTLPDKDVDVSDANTPAGNVYTIIENGVETPEQRELLGRLLALGVARSLPQQAEQVRALAGQLVWLAAHTPCNALDTLDEALGERANALWEAIAKIVTVPTSAAPDFGHTEQLVAAAALCNSTSDVAHRARLHLVQNATDPVIRNIVAPTDRDFPELEGEVSVPPLGPIVTVLLSVTLVLFILRGARLLGRWVLAYKRPASMRLSPRGLELLHRTELMGKVLREGSTLVPFSNLARVTREVRYARVGLFAGLIALVLGTYFGMGLFVDGVRVPGGSPPLLVMAVLLMVAGLVLDFLLSGASDNVSGRCRLVVVPRKGRTLCIGGLEPARADAMLANIAELQKAR